MTTTPTVTQPVNDLRPTTVRWQPLRLGLCNLFHYDTEVFPFRDGRLLLRGNNGAGKSKVLALTLPFLFDGDTSARRIEPDADPGKRMEWNLLMGGDYPASERVGYSWLEFGRLDDDGIEHFVTLGAGLKAAKGQTGTKSWFFITSGRIGADFDLIDGAKIPLGLDRLAAELGELGHVYKTKRDYRRAVDETLFGLGERRYDALIDLLIQIRAPQLSKRPSEKLLSDALTESLTPIPQNLIQSVADGMRGLDEYRAELQQFVDTRKFVDSFLTHYTAYARVLVKRQSEGPRRTQADYDAVGRSIIDLTAKASEAGRALSDLQTVLSGLQQQQAERDAESEALRDSEFAGLDSQLKAADLAAAAAEQRSDRSDTALGRAQIAHDAEIDTVEGERAEVSEAIVRADSAREAVMSSAQQAGLGSDDIAEALPGGDDALSTRIAGVREALRRVSELLDAVAEAEVDMRSAQKRVDDAEVDLGEAALTRRNADDTLDSAAQRYVAEAEKYLASLVELTVTDEEFERFAEWTSAGAGENPVRTALADSAVTVSDQLSALRSQASARLTVLNAEIDQLDAQIAALEGGESPEPPVAHTRDISQPGIPLWRAVSFHDGVDDGDRAGIEAALEASGLLTAVVTELGDLREPSHGEVVLRGRALSTAQRTLGSILRVDLSVDSILDPAAVDAVLSSIAVSDNHGNGSSADAENWVSVTGQYGVGAVRGAWAKPHARYIGDSARTEARALALALAIDERVRLAAAATDEENTISLIADRAAIVKAEQKGMPASPELDAARREVIASGARAEAAAEKLANVSVEWATKMTAHEAALVELEADALVLGLPADATAIRDRSYALDALELDLRDFTVARDRLATASRILANAEGRLGERAEALGNARAEQTAAHTASAAASAAAATLRSLVGDDVIDYRVKVAAVAEQIENLKRRVSETYESVGGASRAEAIVTEQVSQAQARQSTIASDRVASVDALRRTTALGLVNVAMGDVGFDLRESDAEWTVTHGVQVARAVESALAQVDASDVRFERVQSKLVTEYTVLQPALGRHGNQATLHQQDHGYQVLVVFAGQQRSLPELAEGLATIIAERERLLNASEREVIENQLVAEVGTQLSELVGEAETQIADLNTELNSRPTSTGMKLRVRWKPRADGPTNLIDARSRLSKIAAAWDADDRRALGDFLQARIAEVRESDESGNWYDSLGDALDYRRWHHFVVERYQAGVWRAATGPASGGERVLAASIPLFAAASSHYRTASNVYAPRLVMLDEAFAGVDDNSRASCLGLLASFDLDVVMTSEREWGCYAEVPGLSIAQLSRFEDTPAVLVQLWKWDGRVKTRVVDEQPQPAADGAMW